MRLAVVTGLTAFRVAAAIVIAAFLWPQQAWAAILILMLIAFMSDLFDGMLARRWQVVSWFGKIADPLADKIICLTVLWLVAAYFGEWPFWLAAALITAYDVTTMALRFAPRQATHSVGAASKIAKAKTTFLMISLLLFVVAIADDNHLRIVYYPAKTVGSVLLALACVLAVWSLTSYLQQRKPKEEHEQNSR